MAVTDFDSWICVMARENYILSAIDWAETMFGPQVSREYPPVGVWYVSWDRDFYFRNEADATMFALKWS